MPDPSISRRGLLAGSVATEAATLFADAPESWARRAFRDLIYFNAAERGGHFVALEHPELFAQEMRAAFRTLR